MFLMKYVNILHIITTFCTFYMNTDFIKVRDTAKLIFLDFIIIIIFLQGKTQ